MVIGIGGRLCAGKDRLIGFFKEHHTFCEIDVDKVGHRVLEEKKEEVAEQFGGDIMDGKGGIDRKKLGSVVFSSQKQLYRLERILHPPMRAVVSREIEEAGRTDIIVNAALLFHMNLHFLCDTAIWVAAPKRIRIERLMQRDAVSREEAQKMVNAQSHLKPNKIAPYVDIYIVKNSGSLEELESRAVSILKNEGLI
jgi:dephospho-CoA kinase